MEAYEIIVDGRVQGVGYRHFAVTQARALHICGCVKNLYDGRVKIIASGETENLQKFIDRLQQGPRFAHVCDLDKELYLGKENFRDFSVRF